MIRIVTAALLAGSIVAGVPASAQDLPTAKVGYADLDLSTAAGKRTLERRISKAINEVCLVPDTSTLEAIIAYKSCTATARIKSDAQVAAAIDKAVQTASRAGAQVASR